MSGTGPPRRLSNPTVAIGVAGAVVIAIVAAAAAWWLMAASNDGDPAASPATTPATTPAAATSTDGALGPEPEITVVAEYPHDSTYTQGLEFIDGGPDAGLLLESGGFWGESTLRVWDPTTGEVIRVHEVDDLLFAEGATIVGEDAWQLTWQAETAFRYNLETLTPVEEVSYEGQGWGLCLLGQDLIMSNGSAELTFRDPDTFDPRSTVQVTRDGAPVELLNELECVTGTGDSDLVWANIYQSTEVVAIEPTTGEVVHTIDAAELVPEGFVGDTDRVLNGIAYNSDTGRYWLTGKRWPVIYEVELR